MEKGVVEFEQTPEGFTVRPGHPLLGDIHADFSSVGPDDRQGTARAFLVGAALNCICGTLCAALLSRGVEYRAVRGRGTATKENVGGVSMVTGMRLEVTVEAGEEDRTTVEHCLSIVKGCMITRSLVKGMDVSLAVSCPRTGAREN